MLGGLARALRGGTAPRVRALPEALARGLGAAEASGYRVPFWPLAARWRALQPALGEELERAFSLRSEAELAAYLAGFEEEYARFAGAARAVGTSSGTAALESALRAAGVRPGDRVLVPAFGYVASALAVANVGAEPVFVDAGTDGQLDAALLPARLRPGTRALLAAHLFGTMADPAPLLAFCRREGLALVEDACQAHAVRWDGRAAGTFGRAGAVSFNFMKLLAGPGNGGIVLAPDEDAAEAARRGRDPESGAAALESRRTPGYLDPVQAACVRAGLSALPRTLAHHERLAAVYRARLEGSAARLLGAGAPGPRSWHRLVVLVPERERVRRALKARGVETRVVHERPLPSIEGFAGSAGSRGDFPVAGRLCREALALPIGVHLDEAQAAAAADALLDALRG